MQPSSVVWRNHPPTLLGPTAIQYDGTVFKIAVEHSIKAPEAAYDPKLAEWRNFMKFRWTAISPRWDYALVASVAFAVACLRISDWQTRLAMVSGDDSLAAVAFCFAHPLEFAKDAYIQAWAPIALASMQNWLPALAYKYVGIHPSVFFVGITVGQIVGLALAMFCLAKIMTDSRSVAWITAMLTILWRPNWWNLALISDLDWMPYANWGALPFLVYAFASVVNGRRVRAYICLLVAAMIHPIMGMLGTIIAVAYIAHEAFPTRNVRRVVEAAMAAVAIGALSGIPILIATSGIAFSPEDQLPKLLGSYHVRPWGSGYPFSFFLLNHLVYLLTLIVLAWSQNTLYRVSLVVSSAMILVHVASVLVGISPVMTVIASRASILMVLIALPLAVATMWEALRTGPRLAVIPILAFVFQASPVNAVASALAVKGGRIGAFVGAAFSALVLATHTPLAPLVDRIARMLGDWTFSYLQLGNLFWGALGAGLIGVLVARLGHRRPGTAIIVGAVAYAAISGARISGRNEVSGKYYDYKDAQVWARDHTEPGTLFVLLDTIPELAWRSLSERPAVSPLGVGTAYKTAKVGEDYNARLRSFYAQVGMKEFQESQLKIAKEDFWHAFANEFGASYMVRPVGWPPLALTEAYRSTSFVIYKL
jgi:hypothetical protein